jgi:hypothetical protein
MGFKHVVPKRATKIRGGWPYWIIGVIASNAFVEERAMAVFQPDTLIPDQFRNTYKRKSYLTPEKTLMLGVLQDAVICFQDHVGSRDKKKHALFLEAEEWILDKDRRYLFSFENVCESLGLDPGYLRQGLMHWKAATLASEVDKSCNEVIHRRPRRVKIHSAVYETI